ncbi:hypothetical protein JCM10908_000806 [Rhodotorula pacifica]|uniref:uncharacterized protein n=1 Tax=Rhodotorula pacifica TaxID=1495444 RepID=UPI003174B1A9
MHRNPIRFARRFMATTPTGRPGNTANANLAATDSNLARQPPAGYGGSPGPIPQAGPGLGGRTPPPPPPPKGGSNTGLLVGVAALAAGGAYYYLTQTSDGSVHIKSNAEKLEDRAAAKFDALKDRAEDKFDSLKHDAAKAASKVDSRVVDPAKREAGSFLDKLKSPDDKFGAEQVKDAATPSRSPFAVLDPNNSTLGEKVERKARDAAYDARDEARSWGDALRSGPSERKAWKPSIDEIKRYRDLLRSPDRKFGYEQVAKSFKDNGVDVTTGATLGRNPWFDWMGPGHDLHLRSVERKLDQWEAEGKSTLDQAANSVKETYRDAKAETKSWLNWGAAKAEDAKDAAETELERTKRAAEREASSWSSWASRKTEEAKSTVSDAASSAESSAKSAYNDAASAAEQAKRDTEREAKSWWNWSGEKAQEGKESLKDGLLAAERGVEHGAQKAQYETKKL